MKVVELDAAATHDLRRRVLRSHLPGAGVAYPEDDRPGTVHLGVVDGAGAVLAIATVFPEPAPGRPGVPAARLRGMAVDPDHRGRGLGSLLLAAVVAHASAAGCAVLWANGRDDAVAFYQRHGWRVEGEGFESVGLPHHVLLREL